jgi:hypothetical protein
LTGGGHEKPGAQPCLFLWFEPGGRPDAAQLKRAVASSGIGSVTFDPSERGHDAVPSAWLEILLDGLTFDLLGIEPGGSLTPAPAKHRFGALPDKLQGEAIGIAPGPHLAAAANLLPVVRTILRIGGALLGALPGGLAVQWNPSSSLIGREAFLEMAGAWIAGGAFPALGLAGVVTRADGGIASDGLAFFNGHEIALDAGLCRDRVEGTRLLVRLIDRLHDARPLDGDAFLEIEGWGRLRLRGSGGGIEVTRG